jgi:carbonic anhydrase
MAQRLNTDIKGYQVDVLTREAQAKLTPQEVMRLLREGNARFVAGEITARNHVEQVRRAAKGQFPKAVVLSCLDSRIPVEDVFDCGIGDLFVARVAGNFANTDIIASMEFACKVAGAKLVVVMGHEYCGAIMGAIDQVELGHLTSLLDKLQPAVNDVMTHHPASERSSQNAELVRRVAERNVTLTVESIRRESEILRMLEAEGDVLILGAMYNMESARVTFFT